MTEISIVVPVYNVEKYLEKCLQSILSQTFKDFEVILVDDGSTDATSEICKRYAELDSRINIYHKKNGGVSSARNYAMRQVTGKYVTFIDGDDYVDTEYLGYMYNLIKKEEAQICMIQEQVLLEDKKPLERRATKEQVLKTEDAVRRMLLRKGVTHTCWGKLFETVLWEDIKFPEGKNYEDYAVVYHVFAKAKSVVYSNAMLYFYVQRRGSIMHETCSEKTLEVLDISDFVSEYVRRKWPQCEEETLDLQVHIYLKNLQSILKTGMNAFPDYQNRIFQFVRRNCRKILFARHVLVKEKVKVLLLVIGKKCFLNIYCLCDGNRKIK